MKAESRTESKSTGFVFLQGIKLLPQTRLSDIQKAFYFMNATEKFVVFFSIIIALSSCMYVARTFYINHTETVKSTGGTYREGVIGQPRLINPILASTYADQSLVRLVFQSLYKYGKQGEVYADAALALPEKTDDKTYVIKLKPGLKWHDGRDVTSQDVVYTVQALQSDNGKNPYTDQLKDIDVVVRDSTSFELKLKDAKPNIVYALTFPIAPQHVWEKVSKSDVTLSDYNLNAIGSGPYIVKEIKKLKTGKITSITLKANQDYEPRVYLDQIVLFFYDDPVALFYAYRAKELDGIAVATKDLPKDGLQNSLGSSVFESMLLPQYTGVFFNVTTGSTADLGVRQALAMVTDKLELIKAAQSELGVTANSPILVGHYGYQDLPQEAINYDKARELLDTAGYKINTENKREKGGKVLTINLYTNDSQSNIDIAHLLEQQWEKLNLDVNVVTMPTKDLAGQVVKGRNFDALLFAENTGPDGDPFAFWHSSQAKYPGLNLTGLSDPNLDRVIMQARGSSTVDEKIALHNSFREMLLKQMPAIFLYQGVIVVAHSKDFVDMDQVVVYDPAYRFMNAGVWSTKTSRAWKKSQPQQED